MASDIDNSNGEKTLMNCSIWKNAISIKFVTAEAINNLNIIN